MDTIYFHGDIITMVNEEDHPEALCVDQGKICYIGSKEEAFRLRTEKTQMIDLEGKALLPGFIDTHSHIASFSQVLSTVNLQDCTDFSMILRRMKEWIREKKIAPGEWIIGFGYDQNRLKERKHPDKELLDQITTDHPMLISHVSGHMGVFNSSALALSGINKDTPDPEGGKIGRFSESGEPNGYLEEAAFTAFSSRAAKPSEEQLERQMQLAQEVYLKNGITTAQEGKTREAEWELLVWLSKRNKLVIDIVAYVDMQNSGRIVEQANPKESKQYHHHLKLGGYKIFLDGSPQGRTAWMAEPYEGEDKNYTAYPVHTNQQVETFMAKAIDENQQLLVHCNGDAAAQQMIDCYRTQHKPGVDSRPVMIHAQLVRPDQLKEMKSLGILPSFFVAHTYYWGDIHRKNFGEKRAAQISPAKSAQMLGLPYTFHQDTPVIEPNMLETVWCAVNRRTKDGMVLGEEQRLTPYEAFKGITVNAAYQYFEELEKGTLEVGKKADLVILSQNPLKVPVEEIKQISVYATIKDGIERYSIK